MKTYPISHYNGKRAEDELVIYNEKISTETNQYGFEACVQNGRIIKCGGNNNIIPEGGFVVSGHGKAALFLADTLCIGAKVSIDEENRSLIIEIDGNAQKRLAEERISVIKCRIADLEAEHAEYDKFKVSTLLESAVAAMESGDYSGLKSIFEEAYYYTAKSVPDETRGVWHRPYEKSDDEVEQTVKRFADAGFNQLLIETNYEGFANAQHCVHDYLPIREGYENGFDVIDSFIRMGKKHGVKIHAWYENFFFGVVQDGCPMAEIHPEWMAKRKDGGLLHDGYDGFYFLNPALDEVRAFLVDSCRELLDNYDFDGLQLDYIRYPMIKDIDHAAGFDEATKKMFLQDTGIELDKIEATECTEWERFTDWCAAKVTDYVEAIYALISEYRAKGRNIELTTAVVGDPIAAIRSKCQNWRYWVKQGWLDAIYPMAYFNDASEVGKEVAYMVDNYGEAPNISGIAPMMNNLPTIEATKQVEVCREAGAKGVAFFSAYYFNDEQLKTLKNGVFRHK